MSAPSTATEMPAQPAPTTAAEATPATDAPAAPATSAAEDSPAPPQQSSSPAPTANSNASGQATSLYVGELDPTVNEAMLYEIFSMVGPVSSIRVCRDAVTRRSLGYAYVNYLNAADGERALEQLNYSLIKNRPCRIMWSQRDPALRKTGAGNVFIKNLDEGIDTKALHDTFQAFGNILSCKVATSAQGESLGYGFVHYDTKEAAQAAIDNVNGMSLNDKVVYVGMHIPRRERQAKIDEIRAHFTNLYVKNVQLDASDEEFKDLFDQFGQVTSCILSRDSEGKSKGFGFVNYASHEDAKKAVDELHEKDFKGQQLYVARAQKKSEREDELKRAYEQRKYESNLKYQGVNLYVKNLDDEMTEEKLQTEFEAFGQITSCKIMMDDKGASKGFGFVCFSAPDEATKAVAELNGKMIGAKPIYVALAQRKEVRRQQLEAQVAQRNQIRTQQQYAAGMPGMPPYMGGPGMYYGPPSGYPQPGARGPMGYPQPGPGGMPRPRFYAPPGQMPGMPPMPPYGQVPPQQFGQFPGAPPQGPPRGPPRPGQQQQPAQQQQQPQNGAAAPAAGQRPPMSGQPLPNGAPAPRGAPGPMRGPGGPGAQQGRAGYKLNQGTRNAPEEQGQGGLTAATLANAAPQERKQMLGEALYPKIHATHADLAGKITGMLLEMDTDELLYLIENDEALSSKVSEAIQVLEEFNKQQTTQGGEAEAAPAA